LRERRPRGGEQEQANAYGCAFHSSPSEASDPDEPKKNDYPFAAVCGVKKVTFKKYLGFPSLFIGQTRRTLKRCRQSQVFDFGAWRVRRRLAPGCG
jgi:hypothetical protein